MLDFLGKISVTCFFTSYLVVLVLELLRLLGRFRGRAIMVIGMMSIGLFTHITYLILRALSQNVSEESGLLASWTDWSLLLAFGLAISFLVFYVRRPDTVISFFFMPLVLATIGLSVALRGQESISRDDAAGVWGSIHGLSMMIGSGAVLIGFLACVMYLVQSWRLKQKRAGSALLKLPTLETLGRMNRRSLVVSTAFVAIGVVAGIVMNLNRQGFVGWTSGGVLFSVLLFVWLIAATAIEYMYVPASHGRKALCLALASLGFLTLAMIGVLGGTHGVTS